MKNVFLPPGLRCSNLRLKLILLALILPICSLVYGQDIISGKVTDSEGEPLIGVNAMVKGTSRGAVTNIEGNFKLEASANDVIVLSYIGFVTEEVPVGNRSNIEVSLMEDIESLQEVVVVGYGTQKKSDITGAVTSVKADQLQEIATPDVLQALQGRVAGVQIIANSGEPGAGMRIRIRGTGSLNAGSDPLYVVDGFQTGDISYLNPNDIESMEILKDASATAIYGSRGANGVVLISTKKGKVGKPQFTFDAYGGVQQAARLMPLTNAAEYATLRLEAYENDGREIDPLNSEHARLLYARDGNYKGTDWQDEVLNPAPIQNYSLNVNGGNERQRYSVSGTYFNQEGMVKNSGMQKFFMNFNTDYKLSDWLTAGLVANFVNTDKSTYNNDFYGGILSTALAGSPIVPAWDYPSNNYGRNDISYTNSPARSADESKFHGYNATKLVGNLYLDAKIWGGLSFRTQIGVTTNNSLSKSYSPQFFMATDEARDRSELNENRSESMGWISTNYFSYEKSIADHDISATLGYEAQAGRYSSLSIRAFEVPADPAQHFIGAAKDPEPLFGSGQGHNALQSVFARANYSLKDRYLLTGTVRYDGSSNFTKDFRWGMFPSVSAGWVISEEQFLQNLSELSFLKLRAGWGQVGNQSIGANRYVTTVSINQRYSFADQIVQGAAPLRLSNPAIQWETAESLNFGFESGFFNNRVTLTADYFIKNMRDLLLTRPIPMYVGALAPTVNAGTMKNSGLELALGYRNSVGKLGYDVNFNMDFITNEVTSLAGGEPINGGGVGKLGNTTRTEEGHEVAYFFGLQTDGIFNTQAELDAHVLEGNAIQPEAELGDVKFVDVDVDGEIDADDRVRLGSATPDFTFGFSSNFTYGNFDLSFQIIGVQGADAVLGLGSLLETSNGMNNSLISRLDRWTPENPNSNEPRMTFADLNQNAERFSDRYVEDASYVRLRNIQLGYNFPLSDFNIQGLRVYVSADNLVTMTKYRGFDPEIAALYSSPFHYGVDQATYPVPKIFRAGINLKF